MKKVTLILLLGVIGIASAQSNYNVEETQFKINILVPAINYEIGIANNSTLDFELGTGFALRGNSEDVNFGFFPYLEGQYRYYTNFSRRLSKGKNIQGNSGNYVGALVNYTSGNPFIGDLNSSSVFLAGPVYGIQRTYAKGFNFGLEFGAAVFTNGDNYGVGPILDFSIGWVIGKKR